MRPPVTNTIFYLIGPPGVGKLSVGRRLVTMIGGRLVDNHLWLNPVLSLIDQDGVTPLPAEVWPLVARVRHAVFEAANKLTPASSNLVFTHAAVGDNEADREIAAEVIGVAENRQARLIAVLLNCSADALAARVASAERQLLFKETDAAAARKNATRKPFDPGCSTTIVLDTTDLDADSAAREIVRLAGSTYP
jgi:hypothetical protein